jgi:hypothetical protein
MSKRKPEDESRQFARIPKEVKVEVNELTYPLPKGPGEVVKSKDISPVGVCFVSPTLYKKGTILTVNVHLPGWQRHKKNLTALLDDDALAKPLSVIAEVVWSKKGKKGAGYDVGVNFRDINDDDYQAIIKALGN